MNIQLTEAAKQRSRDFRSLCRFDMRPVSSIDAARWVTRHRGAIKRRPLVRAVVRARRKHFAHRRWLMAGLRDWERHTHQATLDWAPYVSTEKP